MAKTNIELVPDLLPVLTAKITPFRRVEQGG
jgi:hypothetical protein